MSALRVRLTLLVLIALIPGIVVLALLALSQRATAEEESRRNSLLMSRIVVNLQDYFTKDTQSLLRNVAQIGRVADGILTEESCQRIFGALLYENRLYANIGYANRGGDIICSAYPNVLDASIADERFFQTAVETYTFTVGDYQIERILNRPTLTYAQPVLDDQYTLTGVLYAALDLRWLEQSIANLPLPEGSSVTVTDGAGVVLANHPPVPGLVGKSLRGTEMIETALNAQDDMTAIVRGVDGRRRFYAFTRLQEEDSHQTAQIYVSLGVPVEYAFAPVSEVIASGGVAIVIFGVVATLGMLIGGEALFLRRIRHMVTVTGRFADGELDTRMDLPDERGELQHLADAFNHMADSLTERIKRTEQQERELTTLYEALSALFIRPNVYDMAHEIAQVLVEYFGYVDCGVMLLTDDLQIVRVGRAGEYNIQPTVALRLNGPGLVPEALRTGKTIYVPDVREDERYVTGFERTRTELVVPLQSDERIIGVIDLQSPEIDAFDERQQRIVLLFAQRASIALDNARLYSLIQQYNQELELRVAERTAELIEAIEKERRLSELKTRFTSMVSHEFRTPLTVIRASNDLVSRYADRMSEDKRRQHLDIVRIQVDRLTQLLDDVMYINKSNAVGLRYEPVFTDMRELCEEAVNEARIAAQERYRIRFEVPCPCEKALVDPKLIRLMLNNLLSNAMKYSPEHSEVLFRLDCCGEDICIIVQDRGIGIPQTDLDYLFQDFHRASNASAISGTGLGLSVVKRVVEVHHGSIDVQTEVDQGTRFMICLPIKAVPLDKKLSGSQALPPRATNGDTAPAGGSHTPNDI